MAMQVPLPHGSILQQQGLQTREFLLGVTPCQPRCVYTQTRWAASELDKHIRSSRLLDNRLGKRCVSSLRADCSVLLWCVAVVAVSLLATSFAAVAAHPTDLRHTNTSVTSAHTTDHHHVGGVTVQYDIDDAAAEMCNRHWRTRGFRDVHSSHYGAVYILCAQALGITKGVNAEGTVYDSQGILSRAQMAAFLARLWGDSFDCPKAPEGASYEIVCEDWQTDRDCPTEPEHSFRDISGSFAAADIACIYALGITKGTNEEGTVYNPQGTLTAAQITRFIARLLNKAEPGTCDLISGSGELALAAGCLERLHIAPSTVEAAAATPATRAQMAVYLVGAWHHIAKGKPPEPPVKPPAHLTVRKPRYTALSAGWDHTCAIRTDKTATCWGSNHNWQTNAPSGRYTAITAGWKHSCAIRTDNTATCWGSNHNGQTDAPDGRYTAITAGHSHSCAIRTDNTAICWGWNNHGQADAPDGRYTAITAGHSHSCAIRTDDTAVCWGFNDDGRADAPDGEYTAISVGGKHTCAIRTDETATCWGWNNHGQADAPDGRYIAISAGLDHSCAIRTDDTAVCWGFNDDGRADAPDGEYTAISVGGKHTCAIRTDETAACWTGHVTVKLHVCAEPELAERVTVEGIRSYAEFWNSNEAPFYTWQSSGMFTMRMEPGLVIASSEMSSEHPFTGSFAPDDCLEAASRETASWETASQKAASWANISHKPYLLNHFITYGHTRKGAGYAVVGGSPSVTFILPDEEYSDSTLLRKSGIILHELDHNVGVSHENDKNVGDTRHRVERDEPQPGRLEPSMVGSLSGYRPTISNDGWVLPTDVAYDAVSGYVYPCYELKLLGWPHGDGHPACIRIPPPRPRDVTASLNNEGRIVVSWSPPGSNINTEPITGYWILLFQDNTDGSAESCNDYTLVKEYPTSAATRQFTIPEQPPGRYCVHVSTASAIGNLNYEQAEPHPTTVK